MNDNFTHLHSLLSKNEEELYEELGFDIARQAMFAEEPSKKQAELRGRAWMEEHLDRIKESLCKDGLLERFIAACDRSDISLALYLADFAAHHFTGIPPFTLAVIIVKTGAHRLCGE